MIDIEDLLNLSYVQMYTINAYKVVFIRRRRRGANSSHSTKSRNNARTPASPSNPNPLTELSPAPGTDFVPGYCCVCNRLYAPKWSSCVCILNIALFLILIFVLTYCVMMCSVFYICTNKLMGLCGCPLWQFTKLAGYNMQQ